MELCSQDKFLILATDGVWEFITPQVGCGQAGWLGCGVPALLRGSPAVKPTLPACSRGMGRCLCCL